MLTYAQVIERKSESSYPFSSVQFTLPKLVAKPIIQWGEDTVPDEELYEEDDDPSYGREYETHVTILYGIHTDSSCEVKRLLGRQKPFEIELGKISAFQNCRFDVVKIEVESPELRRLHKMIADHVECEHMWNAFRPHITIAFLKPGLGSKYIGTDVFQGVRLEVDRASFSNTKGCQMTIPFKGVDE